MSICHIAPLSKCVEQHEFCGRAKVRKCFHCVHVHAQPIFYLLTIDLIVLFFVLVFYTSASKWQHQNTKPFDVLSLCLFFGSPFVTPHQTFSFEMNLTYPNQNLNKCNEMCSSFVSSWTKESQNQNALGHQSDPFDSNFSCSRGKEQINPFESACN